MKRLTISNGEIKFYGDVYNKCSNSNSPSVRKQLDEGTKTCDIPEYEYKSYSVDELKTIYNRLAELEDKIESGLMIELPCKAGTTVFVIDYPFILRRKITQYIVLEETVYADISKSEKHIQHLLLTDFNKTWFLDNARAEAKLKELKEKL